MSKPVRYVLPRIERALHRFDTTVLIIPVPAGLPDRYDVLRLRDGVPEPRCIGCELPLDLAMETALRRPEEDCTPLPGAS